MNVRIKLSNSTHCFMTVCNSLEMVLVDADADFLGDEGVEVEEGATRFQNSAKLADSNNCCNSINSGMVLA